MASAEDDREFEKRRDWDENYKRLVVARSCLWQVRNELDDVPHGIARRVLSHLEMATQQIDAITAAVASLEPHALQIRQYRDAADA